MNNPYADQTIEVILNRILTAIPEEYDVIEGSWAWDMLVPEAQELARMYDALGGLLQYGFVRYSMGDYLKELAAEVGVTPVAGQRATGVVQVTANEETTIQPEDIFSTLGDSSNAPVEFTVNSKQAITVPASVATDIPVICSVAGVVGNVGAGKIKVMLTANNAITLINNATACSGGTDDSSDDEIREMYFERVNSIRGGGNASDYRTWCREYLGLSAKVLIDYQWDGPSTVRVVVTDNNGAVPAADTILALQEIIMPVAVPGQGTGLAPMGAIVTVAAAVARDIDIVVVNPTFDTDFLESDVLHNVEAAMTALLATIDIHGVVRYKDCFSAISGAVGLLDFDSITVNQGTANITLAVTEIAVLGAVTFEEV